MTTTVIIEGSLLDVRILAVGPWQSSTGQKDSYFKKELESLTSFLWTMGIG